jgi:hypothetical protein
VDEFGGDSDRSAREAQSHPLDARSSELVLERLLPGGGNALEADGAMRLRSEDGRAELVLQPGAGGDAQLLSFQAERSEAGLRAAHVVFDNAPGGSAGQAPELTPGLAPHPERVNLLSDESASREFWRDRSERASGASGDDGRGDDFAQDTAASTGGFEGMAADDRVEGLDLVHRMEADAEKQAPIERFETPEHWVRDINAPGTATPGRDYNCVFASRATEARWRGVPMKAGEWPHRSGVSRETAEAVVGPLAAADPSEIEQTLREAGPGSSGVVAMYSHVGGGHMMNVVNDSGIIRWVDGQAGTVSDHPWAGAKSYLWNGHDPEGKPL